MRRPRLAGRMAMSSLPSWYVAERVAQATALSTVAGMAGEARAAQDVPQVVEESVEMVQTNSQARVDDQTVDVAVPLILESLYPREPVQQWANAQLFTVASSAAHHEHYRRLHDQGRGRNRRSGGATVF